MLIDENTSREDLETAIVTEDGLYEQFDEAKLLSGDYSREELLGGIVRWIEAGDEAA